MLPSEPEFAAVTSPFQQRRVVAPALQGSPSTHTCINQGFVFALAASNHLCVTVAHLYTYGRQIFWKHDP